jgi:cell wall-associated NlpC family hydrolase
VTSRSWFNASVSRRRRALPLAALVLLTGISTSAVPTSATAASTGLPSRSADAAFEDQQNLRLAAYQVQAQALAVHALQQPVTSVRPAVVLFESADAILRAARASGVVEPRDTRALMGPVPFNLSHPISRRPWHQRIGGTHTLRRFSRSAYVGGSAGIGMDKTFRHSRPGPFQRADGIYVDPNIPLPPYPTVAAVAIRAALKELGQPYVWAAAGPDTFDCSGLVRYAYGRAGLRLTHYTGTQWNEGRLIRPMDALPGDLVLVGRTLHHVGIYLGAGWMLNAPFTGHYVDVVPVPSHVAGLVRP